MRRTSRVAAWWVSCLWLLGCGAARAPAPIAPLPPPAATPQAQSQPQPGDACFDEHSEAALSWRALGAVDSGARAPSAAPAAPSIVDASAFRSPVRLQLHVIADTRADASHPSVLLLTVLGGGGESRTLQLHSDAAGCRFERSSVSVTCFEAGAWLDFSLARRGPTVYVSKQLGDEAEPAPGPSLPYAEIRLPAAAPLPLLQLMGEAAGPPGPCTTRTVEHRSL